MNNSNYQVIFDKKVEDLQSQAILLKHKKSGARVFVLSNDDDNKVFYIGFRTPPSDNTGVAHIMEHSTLCGSRKFPLKDPFVELAKGSLNTFLNAMTYPDKTVYPVASCNDKDFKNLMDVYLDAVFYPNVYKYPEIMKQEGWSYRIESKDDPIQYNGVVYNEMKGAFSSADDKMSRITMSSLFPDTTYGVESDGDPKYIPDLTYEAFLDFHNRFYHPSNSYIFLYGDMDVEERLAWLDQEYLKDFDKAEIDSEIKYQAPFDRYKIVEDYYSITDDEPEENNTYLSFNIVCGDCLDVKTVSAMQLIVYALIDNQGAPVRQRLLDEGIGKDIQSSFDDGVLQPYLSICAKNANACDKDRFVAIIKEEFEKACKEGINKKSLVAQLNSLRFKYKEGDFGGLSKGLIYGLSCLSSWLYDDTDPLKPIELNSVFDDLEKEIETDYYEQLVKKLLLDNEHATLVVLSPSKGLSAKEEADVAKKLKEYKESLSDEQIEALIQETKALAAYQEEPSSKEALETIPLLERSDIKRSIRSVSNIESDVDGVTFLHHDYYTNGIAYLDLMFDCNEVDADLLQYLSLVKSVISFLNTENYSYSDLNDEINIWTGGLSMECGIYSNPTDRTYHSILADMSIRVLYGNIDKAFDLMEEIFFKSKYDDKKRFQEIICELKSKMQMVIMSSGHIVASMRASSYYSETAALKEYMNGLEFYKFVERVEKDFDKEYEKLHLAIETVMRKILTPSGLLVNCTSDNEGVTLVKARLKDFIARLREYAGDNVIENPVPFKERSYDFTGKGMKLEQKNEAFKTAGAVNYLARAGYYIDNYEEYSGAVNVFQTIMKYEYLWFNIRVQGGAYGCMCAGKADGTLQFLTYRDPNIKRSNDIFEGVDKFVQEFECDEREMTKYVIGTMSDVDIPQTPSMKGNNDFIIYISGRTPEERLKIRNQIIDCTIEDIKKLAPEIRKALDQGNICCVGTETKIEEDKSLFKTVRNLFE